MKFYYSTFDYAILKSLYYVILYCLILNDIILCFLKHIK